MDSQVLTVPPWAIAAAVTLVLGAVYATTRKRRNRYKRWPSSGGHEHHSYWSSARRVRP